MNNISFNNFNTVGNSSNFAAENNSEEKNEDFSAILTNIVSVLQTSTAAIQADSAKNEISVPQEISAGQNLGLTSFDVKESDNNFLEIPSRGVKDSNFESDEKSPVTDDLWAGFPSQNSDKKLGAMVKAKLKAEIAEMFQHKIIKNSETPIKVAPLDNVKANPVNEFDTIQIPGKDDSHSDQLFQAEVTAPIRTPSSRLEKLAATEIPAVTLPVQQTYLSIMKAKREAAAIQDSQFSVIASNDVPSDQIFSDRQVSPVKIFPQVNNGFNEDFEMSQNDVSKILNSLEKSFNNADKIPSKENPVAAELSEILPVKAKNDESQTNGIFSIEKFLENVTKEIKQNADVRPLETPAAKLTEQINPHLLELAALASKKNEKQSLKLRLNPAELGTVEVTVERNHNGTLNAFFQTDTESAKHFLGQNLDQLRENLQSAGWQIGQMEISYGNSNANQQQQQNPSRQAVPSENFSFARVSDQPDTSSRKQSNRLLSLLA